MKLLIRVESNDYSASIYPYQTAKEILEDIINEIGHHTHQGKLRDINGNTIGEWSFKA